MPPRIPARSRSRASSCPTATRSCGPTTACRAPRARPSTRGIDIPHAQLVIRKGYNPKVDSYSAFIEADGKLKTGLDGYLKGRGIKTVFVAGLATDFCVAWTAIDARKLGLDAYVIEDACRGIDTQGSLAAAWKNMEKAGVKRIQSGDLASGRA